MLLCDEKRRAGWVTVMKCLKGTLHGRVAFRSIPEPPKIDEKLWRAMDIEALCSAPPEALTYGPNVTELPSSAPGRPKWMELQASAPSPTPTRAEEHIAMTPD